MNAHDITGGAELMVTMAMTVFIVVVYRRISDDRQDQRISWWGTMWVSYLRLLVGTVLFVGGNLIKTIAYLPEYPALSAGAENLAVILASYATPVVIVGAAVSTAGVGVTFWPWIYERYGLWSCGLVTLATLAVFWAGVALNAAIAATLRNSYYMTVTDLDVLDSPAGSDPTVKSDREFHRDHVRDIFVSVERKNEAGAFVLVCARTSYDVPVIADSEFAATTLSRMMGIPQRNRPCPAFTPGEYRAHVHYLIHGPLGSRIPLRRMDGFTITEEQPRP
jgi:hypothetical protein